MRMQLTSALFIAMVALSTQVSATGLFDSMVSSLAPKDASRQAAKLSVLILNMPRCEVFKERLREAGKGNPAKGSTQLKFVQTMQDAKAAGCRRQD